MCSYGICEYTTRVGWRRRNIGVHAIFESEEFFTFPSSIFRLWYKWIENSAYVNFSGVFVRSGQEFIEIFNKNQMFIS